MTSSGLSCTARRECCFSSSYLRGGGEKVAVMFLAERGSRWPTDGEKVRPAMLCHANLRGTVERLRSVKVIVLLWPMATSPNLRWRRGH